jgi:hypothetical protein
MLLACCSYLWTLIWKNHPDNDVAISELCGSLLSSICSEGGILIANIPERDYTAVSGHPGTTRRRTRSHTLSRVLCTWKTIRPKLRNLAIHKNGHAFVSGAARPCTLLARS